MRLAVLAILALTGTLFWGIIAFTVLFAITHDPRHGYAALTCFGGVVAMTLLLVGTLRYAAVR